ncbi:MAG: zinc ribbon domain-containing protein [Clostridiales bacterium]|nr:zinc ribbon domain-containing protein [Clostridiales bacterium]MDY4621561.1 zinc ribbon domain-containing protein [Eubacteriales bacterium]
MDIFENIGAELNQDESVHQRKLKTMQLVSELNDRNSKLKRGVSELLLKLGMEYYKAYYNDEAAEFAEIITNITEFNRQYTDNCAEIQRLKSISVCSACGAEIAQGYSFCPKCGTRLETEAENGTESCLQNTAVAADSVRTAVQHCPRCGAEMRQNAKFCSKCGYNIG